MAKNRKKYENNPENAADYMFAQKLLAPLQEEKMKTKTLNKQTNNVINASRLCAMSMMANHPELVAQINELVREGYSRTEARMIVIANNMLAVEAELYTLDRLKNGMI